MPAAASARWLIWPATLVGLAADQATKAVAAATLEGQPPIHLLGNVLTIDVSRNAGAAFSFAPAGATVFTAVAVAMAVVIVRVSARLRSASWAIALAALLAGALGNLLDRLLRAPGVGRGAVVDFIDLRHFATFNVADSFITCGAVLALLLTLRGVPMTERLPTPAEPT